MAHVNKKTGEITEPKKGELNKVIINEYRREDGSLAVEFDYSNCPSMAEQHTAHLTDLNYLMEKYKPDELASYLAAREQYRQEILGHDFSAEPDRQAAKNWVYNLRQSFENLDENIKQHFKSHVEFLKFIDNPANQEKMIALGLMTKKEIKEHTEPQKNNDKPNDDDKKGSESKTP